MFCCTLLYVHSSFAIILMGKRELVALLSLSSWCLLMVVWLFLPVPWVCLRFVIVVFHDIFLKKCHYSHSQVRWYIVNRDTWVSLASSQITSLGPVVNSLAIFSNANILKKENKKIQHQCQ